MACAIGQLTTLALDLQLDYLMHPWDAFFTWMQGLIGRVRAEHAFSRACTPAPSNLHIELTNLNLCFVWWCAGAHYQNRGCIRSAGRGANYRQEQVTLLWTAIESYAWTTASNSATDCRNRRSCVWCFGCAHFHLLWHWGIKKNINVHFLSN